MKKGALALIIIAVVILFAIIFFTSEDIFLSANACYDSDDRDRYTAGYVEFNDYRKYDSCADFRNVKEMICAQTPTQQQKPLTNIFRNIRLSPGNSPISSVILPCPDGYECSEGACTEEVIHCEDNEDCPTGYKCRFDTKICIDENAPMVADFKAYELLSVDPQTNEESWREIELENEEIEKGLRVKFDASPSKGPIRWFFWNFPDEGVVVYKQIEEDINALLHIYRDDFQALDEIEKQVYADEGIQELSMTPYSGEDFIPNLNVQIGWDVWSIASGDKVGVVDFSDPENLPAVEIVNEEPVNSAYSLAGESGRLYVSRGLEGVSIYNADRESFELLNTISSEDLGANHALDIAVKENVLFIATQQPEKIVAYDVSTPSQPILITEINIPVARMPSTENFLIVGSISEPTLRIIDIRDPQNPELLEETIDPSFSPQRFSTFDDTLVAIAGSSTAIVRFIVPDNLEEPITILPVYTTSTPCDSFTTTNNRFYTQGTQYEILSKYSITQLPEYTMQQISNFPLGKLFILTDPETGEPVNLVATMSPYGYKALTL